MAVSVMWIGGLMHMAVSVMWIGQLSRCLICFIQILSDIGAIRETSAGVQQLYMQCFCKVESFSRVRRTWGMCVCMRVRWYVAVQAWSSGRIAFVPLLYNTPHSLDSASTVDTLEKAQHSVSSIGTAFNSPVAPPLTARQEALHKHGFGAAWPEQSPVPRTPW